MAQHRKPRRTVLSPRQREFARVVAKTDDVAYAAYAAGYAGRSGGSMAIREPGVQQAILEECRRIVCEELAPMALNHLHRVLSVTAPDGGVDRSFARVQNDAAKIALVQAKDYRDPTSGKALHEMSLEENQALLSAIRQRMREEADDAEIVKQGADDGDVFG